MKRTVITALMLAPLCAFAGPAPENEDIKTVSSQLASLYPATKIDAINTTPIVGLYEVVMGNNIGYTDSKGRFFVFGHLFDMQTQTDLSQQRIDEMNRVNFAELPTRDAIKEVRGKGRRKIAVFSDPDCPFCKRLGPELAKLDDVTILTFLYPLEGLHPEARGKAEAIWCAKDRSKAWGEYLATGKVPAAGGCRTPIDSNLALGNKLGVNGTPTLIAEDGRVLPGAANAAQIDKWLNKENNQ